MESFEEEEEDYYEPLREGSFWSNNYIEYKSKVDGKTLSLEEHLNRTKPYLKYIISYIKKSNMWKIQLAIAINFISSKDNNEERVMHSKSINIEITNNDKADEFIEEVFKPLNKKYQFGLEKSRRGSNFIFDCVHVLCYKCRKINLNCGESYIDSPA